MVSVFPDSTFLPTLNPIEPPWYGPVCPVVWEGWRREVSPYPDLPVVGPRGRAVVAQRVGYEAMVRSNPLALRLPIPKIHPGPMDKDDWRTNAIIDVGQVYVVHPHFRHSPLRSLRSGAVRPRCTNINPAKG